MKEDNIGFRIKEIRKSKNITQLQFSNDLGISQAYVSKIEKGTENPSELLLKFISYRYCVDFNWLKKGIGTSELETGIEGEELINTWNSYRYQFESSFKNFSDTELYDIISGFFGYLYIINNLVPEDIHEKGALFKNRSKYIGNLRDIITDVASLYLNLNQYNDESELSKLETKIKVLDICDDIKKIAIQIGTEIGL